MRYQRLLALLLMVALALSGAIDMQARRKKSKRKKAKTPAVSVYRGPVPDARPLPSEPEERFVTYVYPDSLPAPTLGLEGRNIALWGSHGRFFDQGRHVWRWQRPRMFGTVEDLLPQDIVVSYLAPMLENAGAYVMMPRERDASAVEVIADSQGSPNGDFTLIDGKYRWADTPKGSGFALPQGCLSGTDNPFSMGNAQWVHIVAPSESPEKVSIAEWWADLPEAATHAVYVSYPEVKDAVADAHYRVNHLGGSTDVIVNQRMAPGTWVYIGSFPFAKGKPRHPQVELSNVSATAKSGKGRVGADAVKIGGGLGNIARSEADKHGNPVGYPYPSGDTRYREAARYWLQYAGLPPSVYNPNLGRDDYKDDYMSRANWANYMAGRSVMNPDSAGLGVPVDIALAVHTDAGVRDDGSTVGTLGLYSTAYGRLGNGRARITDCRILAQEAAGAVVEDMSRLVASDWSSRSIKDKRYYEESRPMMPSAIVELLSHQNFADASLARNPQVRFIIGRALYKGILRALSQIHGNAPYMVQPLPVKAFATSYLSPGKYVLSWQPQSDPTEPTALPSSYLIEERIGAPAPGNPFRPKAVVKGASTTLPLTIDDAEIHSYRVTAINAGGRSFPSEVLALRQAPGQKGPAVNIVNAFTRLSGPTFSDLDEGVPLGEDLTFTGRVFDSDPFSEYVDNDRSGYGASRGNGERGPAPKGNTFDFVALHGMAVAKSGHGFISSSAEAFALASDTIPRAPVVDLVMGKQRYVDFSGRPQPGSALSPEIVNALRLHQSGGGSILATGAFVASEMEGADPYFAHDNMSVGMRLKEAAIGGQMSGVALSTLPGIGPLSFFDYSTERVDPSYAVEAPEALTPLNYGQPALRFVENTMVAGVAAPRAITLSVPFESIKDANQRALLMKAVLNYFNIK